MMCREKADVVKDRETEKTLQRIATRYKHSHYCSISFVISQFAESCVELFGLLRGVVQLFNAVKKHQKTIDDKVKEVSGSERKKAKILSSVSKKDFIDVLRRTDGSSGGTVKAEKETVSGIYSCFSGCIYPLSGCLLSWKSWKSQFSRLVKGYEKVMEICNTDCNVSKSSEGKLFPGNQLLLVMLFATLQLAQVIVTMSDKCSFNNDKKYEA